RLGTVRFRISDGAPGARLFNNWGAALSPDGKVIAVAANRQTLLLDAATGAELRSFDTGIGGVQKVAFSPDGKVLATRGAATAIQLWDTAAGRPLVQIRAQGFSSPRDALIFAADGKSLAEMSQPLGQQNDIRVIVWDTTTGKQRMAVKPVENVMVQAALAPDGKILATWGQKLQRPNPRLEPGGAVQLWDVSTGKELRRLVPPGAGPALISAAAFAPDGKALAVATGPGTVAVWDVATGKELRRFAGRVAPGAPVQ